MLVVNLFGGPGAGKSTTAAGLFWLLKNKGIQVELITEYAKALTWAKRSVELSDQFYIYAKQHHRQFVLKGQVSVCITDSPLLIPLIFNSTEPDSFRQYVVDNWRRYHNVNFFIRRVKPYSTVGRNETKEVAEQIDQQVRTLMAELDESYQTVNGDEMSAVTILNHLEQKGLL